MADLQCTLTLPSPRGRGFLRRPGEDEFYFAVHCSGCGQLFAAGRSGETSDEVGRGFGGVLGILYDKQGGQVFAPIGDCGGVVEVNS
jgi:hypothetical protein